METTFYDDPVRYRSALKRPSTLDLDKAGAAKRARGSALLTSPDLHLLKIGSPELEKLIIQQHGLPQPPPPQCLYQTGKGADDQGYADFPDALSAASYPLYHPQMPDIQQQQQQQPSMVDASYGYQQPHPVHPHPPPVTNPCSTSYGYYPGVTVKEEPQTVPCASPPPRSPIDMADQERLKLERKRLRNRIAASKCRRRKLERIARLEDKVAHLKGENAELTSHVTRLKEHVCQLKQQVMEHVRSGCELLVAPLPYTDEL